MDDLDTRLIALLRDDARMSTTALADALRVSRATVQNRMDGLQRDGVLLGFTVRLQPDADDGRVWGIATLQSGVASEVIIEGLRGMVAIEAVHTTTGRWDLVAELSAPTLADFSRAVDEIKRLEGVKGVETSLLLKTERF